MGYCIPGTLTSPLPPKKPTHTKSLRHTLSASIQRNQFPLIRKKVGRRLIRISTAEGKWQGNWNADYNFSLRDLRLDDLVEDGDPNDARVFVSLSVDRHAGFGLSVDGTIDTSFTRKCSNCSSPYCRQANKMLPLFFSRDMPSNLTLESRVLTHSICCQITTNFNVWVLPSAKDGDSNQLPEIGGDDPSVIYVKPGCEADLDSLIKDTIRLTTSVNETCSDFCEKSELGLRHLSNAKAPTVDKRWSKLLELKKSYQ